VTVTDPPPTDVAPIHPAARHATARLAIDTAAAAFADRGVAATSLDDLARTMGVTKQTILYHFKSKSGLLTAVLDDAAETLRAELDRSTEASPPGWPRVESTVRAAFGLAVRRPELLGLLREVGRLGPPVSDDVIELLQPLVDRATASLAHGMDLGHFRRSDPRLVLVSSYAAVTGVVSDPEILRAVGLELDLRTAAQLRRTVLDFLEAALVS
jgi:AcrR family transcriptional regulator